MKTDRLIGILSVLLQRDQMTAPELAALFEVSRRTINRDIDALNQAGIPIVTTQGANGGIRIMEGYRVDRAVLSSADMQAILSGLKSLDSVSDSNRYRLLMEKIKIGSSAAPIGDRPIVVDLASWYKGALPEKIGKLQEAIQGRRLIGFHYASPNGESERQAEPYLLIFQWSSWYLWAWCLTRKAPRLFKLNRMEQLRIGGEFAPREMPEPDLSNERVFPDRYHVIARVPSKYQWRLTEEYGPGCYRALPDGDLLFSAGFTHRDQALSWILSFQGEAELIEPKEMRKDLLVVGEKLAATYRT